MKMAGIDVHKKVLMGVVVDTTEPEAKPVTGAGCSRGGDGIHGPVLAIGVAGAGTAYAFALGAGVLQPCSARAQA